MPTFVRPQRKNCIQVAMEATITFPAVPACPGGGTIPPATLDSIKLQYEWRVRAAILRQCNAINAIVDELELCEMACDASHPDGSAAEQDCIEGCIDTAQTQIEGVDLAYNTSMEANAAWFAQACLASCPA